MDQRQSVAFWVALFTLAAVAVVAYRSVDEAAETLGWVEHTQSVMRQMEEVNAAYSRASSARRAYAIAGDASQLAERTALDGRLSGSLAVLSSLVAPDPPNAERVDRWAALLWSRIAVLERGVEIRRTGGVWVESAEDLARVVRIREVREELERDENRVLLERDQKTRADMFRTKLVCAGGTVVSLAILLFAFYRLRREVARRAKSEEALRASEGKLAVTFKSVAATERFLDSIVENIPNMIFIKGASELRFERINRAGEDLLGLSRKELIGKNDHDFFPEAQAAFFEARDREALAGKVLVDIAEEPIDAKGGTRWLHTKKVPVMDEEGVPLYLLGISEDITERREAAEALKAAKNAAESANHELEAFSYAVAHDLRAPLRSIDGFSLALLEDCGEKLDAVGAEHLHRVRSCAQRMGQTIDALLGLSRLSRGELVRQEVDVTTMAKECLQRLKEASPGRNVETVVQDGLVGHGDVRLLRAALDNLLGNAWKFTSKLAEARIEVGKVSSEEAPFFVRDNGAGFDPAYADKLFGAFQRLHGASEFEGSGIGLATVQRIVRRHGGRVWAEGRVGQGATFYFTV